LIALNVAFLTVYRLLEDPRAAGSGGSRRSAAGVRAV
jgi:hypothetical protein